MCDFRSVRVFVLARTFIFRRLHFIWIADLLSGDVNASNTKNTMDSELSSFDTTSTSVLSVPESISMANNNVVVNNENQLQQQQQPQNPQQQLPQQPLPYHDPPYMIRHSRAFRHFKNPPQPHMCIKDHTEDGQELFINVMKWTKICMPHSASDPIPLYGGMRVSASMFRDDRLKFVPRVSFSAPNQFSKWFM